MRIVYCFFVFLFSFLGAIPAVAPSDFSSIISTLSLRLLSSQDEGDWINKKAVARREEKKEFIKTEDIVLKKDEFFVFPKQIEILGATDKEKQWIGDVFQMFPSTFFSSLRKIEIKHDPDAKRGLGGASVIIIGAASLDKAEFQKVLIHEIGHVVDLGMIRGSSFSGASEFKDGSFDIYENDKSVNFYRISWEDDHTKKVGMIHSDFVSGYAMSDVFEDFSESFISYRLHGKYFREMAKDNFVLQEKYNFLRDYVFEGEEFDVGNSKIFKKDRVWDITKI